MHVLVAYRKGKLSEALCEDFLVVTPDFCAVVDGATDKTGVRIGGETGGRIVARSVASAICALPADVDHLSWVRLVTLAVRDAVLECGWPMETPIPCACAVTYSRVRREIWRVGDCGYRVAGVTYPGGKDVDDLTGRTRAGVITKSLENGATVTELLENDPGRRAIMDILEGQHVHANNPGSALGFPVFNGRDIPMEMLEQPLPVPPESLVVLCSDGFDFPLDTLEATLAAQERSYRTDPLRIGLDGARPSTKGLKRGMERHDDQTYLALVS